jgi:hypothetical protein
VGGLAHKAIEEASEAKREQGGALQRLNEGTPGESNSHHVQNIPNVGGACRRLFVDSLG